MARINIFGDFKANQVKHLNLSAELVYLLNTSDINMVNFEDPVKSCGKPLKKSGPNICQDKDSPEWLELRGFNAISMANNHTMDFGEDGLNTTIEAFDKATVMGVGNWEDAYRVNKFVSKDGLTIGVICCTHCEFGTLTEKPTVGDEGQKGCAWSLSTEIVKNIKDARGGEKYDFLNVFQHGGVEYIDYPLPEWREIYKHWIDIGADAVITSHPHVPQGWEIYKGKPICYSLGNFCFDKLNPKKEAPAHWYDSLCCNLDIEKPHECKLTVRPLMYDYKNGYICDNESAEFKNHLSKLNDILRNDRVYLEYVNMYCKKLKSFYMGQFSRSGWVVNMFSKGFLKGLAEGILGRGFFNILHALNNLQCESHRWAIMRGMKL